MELVDHKGRGVKLHHGWNLWKSMLHFQTPGAVISHLHQVKGGLFVFFLKSMNRPGHEHPLVSGYFSDQKVVFLDSTIFISSTKQGHLMTVLNKPLGNMD